MTKKQKIKSPKPAKTVAVTHSGDGSAPPTQNGLAVDNSPLAKRGRPSRYTPELARVICLRIAAGESLKGICRDDDMPGDATVREWVVDDREGFSAQYTRAIQARAIIWSEEILEIADEGARDTYIDENGNERTDHDVIARSRLRVDTRKWMLSKVLPKIYGDKLDLNHGVQPENPLATLLQRVAGTGLPIIKDITHESDDERAD